MKLFAAIAFVGFQFYVYHYFASDELHPARTPLTQFPLHAGDWQCAKRELMEPKVIENLGVTDYLICNFQRAATPFPVNVYFGYHQSQVNKEGGGGGETRIHPPAHCLPGSGWDIIAANDVALDLPGLPQPVAKARRLVIAKGDARQLVYYWYQERGRVIADDTWKIAWLFWDRARLSRTDGALVRFTVPMLRGQDQASEDALLSLARQVVPLLPAYVPN